MNSAFKILYGPIAAIRLLLLLVVTAVLGTGGVLWLRLFGLSQKQQKTILQMWGKAMLFICGIRVTRNEISASGRFILMANHRNYLDIFILAAYVPAAFVAKAEVQNWPVMKTAALLTNIIFVNRHEMKSKIAAVSRIRELVNTGFPVALFPEGTTSKGPLTQPFKKGGFKIAVELNVPVIPTAIWYKNEEDAWIGKDTFAGHFFRQMGKPITYAGLQLGHHVTDKDYKALKQKVQFEIDGMLQEKASFTDKNSG